MKCFVALFAMVALANAKASPGGYILKGGVVDFQRPLDYKEAAIHAGKVAWSNKYSEELENEGAGFEIRSEKRDAPYIPTFFTSQENHAALTAAAQRPVVPTGNIRPQREVYNKPLYYESYHNRK